MLINSLLSSSEVLYGVKSKHIQMLESCDRSLLTRLFSVPKTCSYEAVFMESGLLPLRFILQGRRLMYYWTILNKPDTELVKKVFEVQKQHSVQDDWTRQVEEDKKTLDIELSEEKIKDMKKEAFKTLVKGKLQEKATEFLFSCSEKHSKSRGLTTFGLQSYLTTEKLSTIEKKTYLFSSDTIH